VNEDDLVIAWERWHKRVSEALYQNWQRSKPIAGIAHARICVTKDRRITVIVSNVRVAPIELAEVHSDPVYAMKLLQNEFAQNVRQAVEALNGSAILEFPEGSKRAEAFMSPNFIHGADSGYEWRKDDYERVKLN
jgi:hypothetical protein